MRKNFTLNDLIRYHYNELSSLEAKALESWIFENEDFASENRKIKQAKRFLNYKTSKPSHSSIRLIMDYSRSSSAELEASF